LSLLLTGMIGNTIMALIIGSVFYNLQDNTASLYSRGALLFFGVLLNAFSSALEVNPKPRALRILIKINRS
jgi:ATP-binding cassette, subfamily G (WHITE), member 2, PDR